MKFVGMPLLIHRDVARGRDDIAVHEKIHVGQYGVVEFRQEEVDDVGGENIGRVLANGHGSLVEYARLVTCVHHHHIAIGVGAVVANVEPKQLGEPVPVHGAVGDAIRTVHRRRVEEIEIARGDIRVVGEDRCQAQNQGRHRGKHWGRAHRGNSCFGKQRGLTRNTNPMQRQWPDDTD